MALDKDNLIKNIQDAFTKAKEVEPPKNPNEINDIQDEILTQLAKDLAAAIEVFVKAGEIKITGIKVDVEDNNHNPIGKGTQKEDLTVKMTWKNGGKS